MTDRGATRGAAAQGSIGALIMLACLLLFAHAAGAAELPWRGRPFQIVASEKPLPDLLRELAASQGTTAVVDPKIQGTISGKFNAAPLAILDNLCATYSLTWYFDGSLLYIDPSTETRSEVMSIGTGPGRADWLIQTLMQLRIYDKRFPLLISGREGTARVTGPRRYVELVREAVRLVDRKNAQNDTAEIRLFPLKYAWAADFKITRSGKEVAIPGVANVLRSLYGRNANRAGSSFTGTGSGRRNTTYGVGADRQMKLATGDSVNAPKVDLPGVGSAEGGDTGDAFASFASAGPDELPQFQADTRLNAVLVRDNPARMAQHERLIASMDSRPRLVEIEVTIMDIATDSLDSLGVDWRAHTPHVDFQTGNGNNSPITFNTTTEGGQIGGVGNTNANGDIITPIGGVLTASIGGTLRNYLLARVSALAQKGDANLVARPKVLTLDNNEASLENLSDFYVRVNGFQDASLFKVTTGTSVRVTPLIVDESAGRGVMMSINIEDGDISANQAVDQIPVVLHRTVNTQALIDEGTSLLIAGYSSEQKTNATSGVPVLSNIPVVGNLFKYDQKKLAKQERFYLLTPRLVTPAIAVPTQPMQPAPVLPLPAPPSGSASQPVTPSVPMPPPASAPSEPRN
ncbi:MAG TPA: type III secretion system outer membrane ring subunit SctC [Burkholderiaceae bacterium]